MREEGREIAIEGERGRDIGREREGEGGEEERAI